MVFLKRDPPARPPLSIMKPDHQGASAERLAPGRFQPRSDRRPYVGKETACRAGDAAARPPPLWPAPTLQPCRAIAVPSVRETPKPPPYERTAAPGGELTALRRRSDSTIAEGRVRFQSGGPNQGYTKDPAQIRSRGAASAHRAPRRPAKGCAVVLEAFYNALEPAAHFRR